MKGDNKILKFSKETKPTYKCKNCHNSGMVRVDVVWFGEQPKFLDCIYKFIEQVEVFISIGTSNNVYPAAGFIDLITQLLKDNGFDKAPTFSVPVWLAKILANFSKELKITLPYLGRLRSVKNTSKAKDVLGWEPRPAEESIVEIAEQMKGMGLIK